MFREINGELGFSGSSSRRLLERRRALDYVSFPGLSHLTGCSPEDLDLLCMKELVDNALDACEENNIENQVVTIFFRTKKDLEIEVIDNGKGFDSEDIAKIMDFNRFFSSKFHYRIPARGFFGNAFKAMIGAPYALSSELGKDDPDSAVKIFSRGIEYDLRLEIDRLNEKVKTETSEKPCQEKNTKIVLKLPVYGQRWGKKQEYIDLFRSYAVFNPEASLKMMLLYKGELLFLDVLPSINGRQKGFQGKSSILWYTLQGFISLIEAYSRKLASEGADESLNNFVRSTFSGFSSDRKWKKIIEDAGLNNAGIKTVRQLNDGKHISNLYDSMKANSVELSPATLGRIGKSQIRKSLEYIYGEVDDFWYGIEESSCNLQSIKIPFVIETGIAALPEHCHEKRRIMVGINHSPCLRNPFNGDFLETEKKDGETLKGLGVTGFLDKLDIKYKNSVVVVVHLTCPKIDYTNYSKSEFNVKPFKEALAKALYKAGKNYYGYKRNRTGENRKASVGRQLLREELVRREKMADGGGIPSGELTTQQGLYYKIRNQMRGAIDLKRKSFANALKEICIAMGGSLSYRDRLGIIAAERAQIYFRGRVEPISFDRIEELSELGSDIILVEKEGICQVLEPYARKMGVALINSRGFTTDYTNNVLEWAFYKNANVFTLTDFDASGMLIALKLKTDDLESLKLETINSLFALMRGGLTPHLGVDPIMIKDLKLHRKSLEEEYDSTTRKAPKNHLKPLPISLQEEVRDKRIEIDAVLNEVGPEKLWNYIQHEMQRHKQVRDLTRSLNIQIKPPIEIAEALEIFNEIIKLEARPHLQEEREKFRYWKGGIINVEEKEEEINTQLTEKLMDKSRIRELKEKLQEIAAYFKNSKKFEVS